MWLSRIPGASSATPCDIDRGGRCLDRHVLPARRLARPQVDLLRVTAVERGIGRCHSRPSQNQIHGSQVIRNHRPAGRDDSHRYKQTKHGAATGTMTTQITQGTP